MATHNPRTRGKKKKKKKKKKKARTQSMAYHRPPCDLPACRHRPRKGATDFQRRQRCRRAPLATAEPAWPPTDALGRRCDTRGRVVVGGVKGNLPATPCPSLCGLSLSRPISRLFTPFSTSDESEQQLNKIGKIHRHPGGGRETERHHYSNQIEQRRGQTKEPGQKKDEEKSGCVTFFWRLFKF